MEELWSIGRELLSGGGAAPAGPAVNYTIEPEIHYVPPQSGSNLGPQNTAIPLGHDWFAVYTGQCFCQGWYFSHGSTWEKVFAQTMQWLLFAICVLSLLWYAYQYWRATCGWEEVYVCIIEFVMVCFELFHEFDSPCMLYLSTGNAVVWLRYSEWLLCCPVILIHLSNLTGLANDYNKRTMALLVALIATIVFGIYSAMCVGWPKVILYLISCFMCSSVFYLSAKVFIEAFHMVPKGICRLLVKTMAIIFFLGWSFFPIIFLFGKSGFKMLSPYADVILSSFGDLISKNLFGLVGHWLRVKIREHILKYGDIRKTTHVKIAGGDTEVETFVEEEDDDTVKYSTKELANRQSFVNMRENMKAKGIDVRASMDGDDGDEERGGKGKAAGPGSTLLPGRVILAVPDISMVDFFQEQFGQLGAPIELVPALGGDNTLLLVQQALQLGGLDFVLMHPEFLKDRSPNGLVARVRMMGQGVCAFGWVPTGPMRELIESSGLDGWLEGPSFGTGIDVQQLAELIGMMQARRKFTKWGGATPQAFGGGDNRGSLEMSPSLSHNSQQPLLHQTSYQNSMMRGGAPMSPMSAAPSNGMMGPNPMMMGGGMGGMNNGMGNMGGGMGGMNGGMGNMGGGMNNNMGSMGGGMNNNMGGMGGGMNNNMGNMGGGYQMSAASNPLYGSPPSPMGSQPGAGMYGSGEGSALPMSTPAPPAPSSNAGDPSEAEMLKQLMKEINRLKTELGEN